MTANEFTRIARRLGYTNADLADSLNTSEDRIARLLDGSEEIDRDTADQITELYQSR
jgi:plasmid maintenance system antidote protein VapI